MLGSKAGVVLCILFKKTMNESEIPSDWKSANVVPLFKKSNKNEKL